MKEYKLQISDAAETDLTAIAEHIAFRLREPATALSQIRRIRKAVESLQVMPERHPLLSDQQLANMGLRMIPVDHYLIFYVMDPSSPAVTVVRVLYGRREWDSLLKGYASASPTET